MSIKIDQAMISRYVSLGLGHPTAFENQTFIPTAGTAYVELINLPNDITALTIDGLNETDGLFRVNVRYPATIGAVPTKNTAEAIMTGFGVGNRVFYSGQYATITAVSRTRGIVEGGWYKITVNITYRAFITR